MTDQQQQLYSSTIASFRKSVNQSGKTLAGHPAAFIRSVQSQIMGADEGCNCL